MSKNLKWTWRIGIQLIAMPVSMPIGMTFLYVGHGFWFQGKDLNFPFLWASATTFLLAAISSYTLCPLVRDETRRKDRSLSKEASSLWYEGGSMMQGRLLFYRVVWPCLCTMWIFEIVKTASHLEIFTWLAAAVLLVAIVADIVAVILAIRGFELRAQRQVREQELEQQTIR